MVRNTCYCYYISRCKQSWLLRSLIKNGSNFCIFGQLLDICNLWLEKDWIINLPTRLIRVNLRLKYHHESHRLLTSIKVIYIDAKHQSRKPRGVAIRRRSAWARSAIEAIETSQWYSATFQIYTGGRNIHIKRKTSPLLSNSLGLVGLVGLLTRTIPCFAYSQEYPQKSA